MLRFIKGSVGLSLLVLTTVISFLVGIALFIVPIIFAAAGAQPGSSASMTLGVLMILGIIVLLISGLGWWVGLILTIIEYTKKKNNAI